MISSWASFFYGIGVGVLLPLAFFALGIMGWEKECR